MPYTTLKNNPYPTIFFFAFNQNHNYFFFEIQLHVIKQGE